MQHLEPCPAASALSVSGTVRGEDRIQAVTFISGNLPLALVVVILTLHLENTELVDTVQDTVKDTDGNVHPAVTSLSERHPPQGLPPAGLSCCSSGHLPPSLPPSTRSSCFSSRPRGLVQWLVRASCPDYLFACLIVLLFCKQREGRPSP